MKKLKPKSARTLRKYFADMQKHCEATSKNPVFGCNTCAYNVGFSSQYFGCYFVYTGGLAPKDWQANICGSIVPPKKGKK